MPGQKLHGGTQNAHLRHGEGDLTLPDPKYTSTRQPAKRQPPRSCAKVTTMSLGRDLGAKSFLGRSQIFATGGGGGLSWRNWSGHYPTSNVGWAHFDSN